MLRPHVPFFMKQFFYFLFAAFCWAALPFAVRAQAQKPTSTTTRTTAKPAATPAAKPAAKPSAKPVTKSGKPAAKPAARPTAAPATRVAAEPTPAPSLPPAAPDKPAAGPLNGPFQVGTNAVNLGIGLGNRYGYGAGFLGGSSSVSPAFSLSYERGIIPLGPGVLGVGLFVGYQGASYDLGGGDKWKYTDIIVALRGAFHYPVLPQFDAYGGLGLGLRHAGASFQGLNTNNLGAISGNELATNLFVGGRYFFIPNIGAFAELGYDQTYLKVGLTAKF